MGKADLHLHSSHSDGLPTVRQLVDYVHAETDIDVVAIADHDQVAGALEAVERCAGLPGGRLSAVVGTEISAAWGRHLVALFFDEPYPTAPFPRFRSLEWTLRLVADAGGIVVVPHPLSGLVPSVGERAMRRLLAAQPPSLQAVELCSGVVGGRAAESRLRRLNSSQWRLAELGSSDAHHLAHVGAAYTRFPGSSARELREAIRARTTEACWGDQGRVPLGNYVRQSWLSLVLKPARELRALAQRDRSGAGSGAGPAAVSARRESGRG